jgi:hypothetical protein
VGIVSNLQFVAYVSVCFLLISEEQSTPSPLEAGDIAIQHHSLWVDKYKPLSTKQIIGQQGDRSNVKKLMRWLQGWHSNHSGKKTLVRASEYSAT